MRIRRASCHGCQLLGKSALQRIVREPSGANPNLREDFKVRPSPPWEKVAGGRMRVAGHDARHLARKSPRFHGTVPKIEKIQQPPGWRNHWRNEAGGPCK